MDDRKPTRRVCIFCGGGPLTREHVWPRWLGRIIEDRLEGRSVIKYVRSADRWESGVIDVVVKQVCMACNSGWMSRLDQQAKEVLEPLLAASPGPQILSPADLQVVAKWTTKQALMTDPIQEQGRLIPDHLYRRFGNRPRPFVASRVLLGSFLHVTHPSRAFRRDDHFDDGGADSGRPNLYVMTFSILSLVVQLIHYIGAEQVVIRDVPAEGLGMIQVWPNPGRPAVWNPDRPVASDRTFEMLAMRDEFEVLRVRQV